MGNIKTDFEKDAKGISEIWPQWRIEYPPLGKGGFGRVYKATEVKEGGKEEEALKAAVKVISIKYEDFDDYDAPTEEVNRESPKKAALEKYEKLKNEIQTMKMLSSHSRIVSIWADEKVERDDSIEIYIRMELLTALDKYLQNRKITQELIIQIGCDICSALESCESKNIIHRDVKISNIFATEDDCFKLGDFGVAKNLEKESDMLKTSIGTRGYMAPEVFGGKAYDHRADIYSLGKVLEILLEDGYGGSGKLCIAPPKNVSEALKEIVKKATETEPQKRFQSASEMRKALEDVKLEIRTSRAGLQSENNTADSQNKTSKAQKKKSKSKGKKLGKFKVAVIVTLVLVAAFIIGAFALYRTSPVFEAIKSFENKDFENAVYIYNDSVKDSFIYKPLFLKQMEGVKDETFNLYLTDEADYDATIMTLTALKYMDLADAEDIRKAESIEAQKEILKSAEESYQKESYKSALEMYSQIPADSPFYEKACTQAQFAFDAYVGETDDKIYNYVASGYYSYAFDTINEAYALLPVGAESTKLDLIKEEVTEKHFEEVSESVNGYLQNHRYKYALEQIENATAYDNSRQLLKLKAETEAKYEAYVKELAHSLSEIGDFNGAKEEVSEALGLLPESTALKNLEEEVNDNLSKAFMAHCKAYDYRNYSDYTGSYGFNMSGKEYTNGFTLYSYGNTDKGYADFNIDKNYKTITFIFGHKDSTGMSDGVLNIYGDGVLIKEVEASASDSPQAITVNVENISILKFELTTSNTAYYGLGRIMAE